MFKETSTSKIWMWHSVPMPKDRGIPTNTYLHYGDTVEIIFTKGIVGEATVNGRRIKIDGDTAIYIAPRQLHSVVYLSGGEFIHVLHINIEKLEKYINVKNLLGARGISLDLIPSSIQSFDKLYKNACIAADEDIGFYRRLIATLEIITSLADTADRYILASVTDSGAARLLEWVEANYSKKVTIKDASGFFGYNKNYFSKWVKQTSGTGFNDFLNSVRISHACVYLSDGRTVEEVAELCGYTDSSYFIKVFKKFRGSTPKNYVAKRLGEDGY